MVKSIFDVCPWDTVTCPPWDVAGWNSWTEMGWNKLRLMTNVVILNLQKPSKTIPTFFMTLSLLDNDTNLQDTNPTYVPVAATSLMQSPDVLDGFCPIDIGEFLLVPDLHASSPFLVLSDHSLAMVVYMSQPSPFPKILRLLASHVCSAHAMHPWQSGEGRPIVPEGIPNNGVAVRSKVCSCRTKEVFQQEVSLQVR